MNDRPLFSIFRICRGIRKWIWWIAVAEKDHSFWEFVWYSDRPHAAHRKGLY